MTPLFETYFDWNRLMIGESSKSGRLRNRFLNPLSFLGNRSRSSLGIFYVGALLLPLVYLFGRSLYTWVVSVFPSDYQLPEPLLISLGFLVLFLNLWSFWVYLVSRRRTENSRRLRLELEDELIGLERELVTFKLKVRPLVDPSEGPARLDFWLSNSEWSDDTVLEQYDRILTDFLSPSGKYYGLRFSEKFVMKNDPSD